MWDFIFAYLLVAFSLWFFFLRKASPSFNVKSTTAPSKPVVAQTPKKVAEAPKVVETPKVVAEAPKVVETPKVVAETPKPAVVEKVIEAPKAVETTPERVETPEPVVETPKPEEIEVKQEEEEAASSSPMSSDEEGSGWVKVSASKSARSTGSELKVEWGVAELQGKRPNMEDAHIAFSNNVNGPQQEKLKELGLVGLWAVYDGHKGPRAAQFAADNLHNALFAHIESNGGRSISETDLREVLFKSFIETDAKLVQDEVNEGYSDGSTAVVALIQEDSNKLFVANIGDAEALLVKNATADSSNPFVVATVKHKPTVPTEKKRIQEAGGFVVMGRLSGLSVSRSFGDKELKIPSEEDGNRIEKLMLEEPDIMVLDLKKDEDAFLIVGCDGVWESFPHNDSVQFVRSQLVDEATGNKRSARELTTLLVKEALRRGSTDNISAIVVLFNWDN